ncbi:Mitotic exit network component [Coniosporium apollinis]|uniref:Mitotic exit network component n=1 Tax=Coniosporium apollinis TaxID=61459 RepID=A0ABQ9NLD1_9PEZI|nr:Mitotic exit network component [Coniosporium apollinis]
MFPSAPKPLPPVFTLAESGSCIHLGHFGLGGGLLGDGQYMGQTVMRPQAAYASPVQRMLRSNLSQRRGERQRPHPAQKRVVESEKMMEEGQQVGGRRWERDGGMQEQQHNSGLRNYSAFLTPAPPPHPPPSSVYNSPTTALSTAATAHEGLGHGIDDILTRLSSPHRNARTRAPFKPQKSNRGTSSWQLKQFAEATLGSGSLRKAVLLPEGEDLGEWLAVNGGFGLSYTERREEVDRRKCDYGERADENAWAVVDFYNQINLLYGSITEFCSPQSCPEMKATDEFEYLWQDNENFKRPTKMPAPQYIEHLMAWVQSNIDNEQMFPSRIGVPFPKSFPTLLRQIFKRLYRVYAHIYCHHYPVVVALGLEPHLNTSFKHYVLFVDEHGLATGKDFWGPLGDLVESMVKGD